MLGPPEFKLLQEIVWKKLVFLHTDMLLHSVSLVEMSFQLRKQW